MTRSIPGSALLAMTLGLCVPGAVQAQNMDPLEGVWAAETYALATGPTHPLAGEIFFADGIWQVLFFVLDEDGTARRGSAEGGTYDRTESGVVFRHLHNLSVGEEMAGLAASELRLVTRGPEDAPLEPTDIRVEGDRLTLSFPSGNRMHFRRHR